MHTLHASYAGRRVLLTGHTGFKGAWLSLWLRELGAEVLGVSLDPPGVPSMHEILRLDEYIKGVRLDLADYTGLESVMNDFRPEIILHLAAQSLVRPSYVRPLETLQTNIMGTAHVLEACRHTPSVRAVLIVTSDKCYRNNEWVWGYRENDPMGGHDTYSVSKGCAELITASYIKSFFPPEEYGKSHHLAVASARAGNAIGGGDWGRDRLIPDCFRALHEGRIISIRYPGSVRPWQHVLECLSGYLLVGARLLEYGPRFGCGWNFAPIGLGDVWPVERVVKKVCALWGGGTYRVETGEHPHEARMLCLDCTKANVELNWWPRYTVEKALEITTQWYREFHAGASSAALRRMTLLQIQEYGDAAPYGYDPGVPAADEEERTRAAMHA